MLTALEKINRPFVMIKKKKNVSGGTVVLGCRDIAAAQSVCVKKYLQLLAVLLSMLYLWI
jgi:hypothetical protein